MAAQIHIVTGGTGFVGSAIILELLQATDARIVGIVRPGPIDAGARLRGVLRHAARLYGLDGQLDREIDSRCEAVDGDVREPSCGVRPRPDWAGAEFWHCAASLQFLDRFEAHIIKTNVDGTRHALELAKTASVEVFNAISTAYVAGTSSGEILEAPATPVETNNHYERSKIEAEAEAACATIPRVRIMRPSIVIGHSRSRAALNFNGMYGFLRSLYKFRRLMERTQQHLGETLRLRMVVDSKASINLIPVDFVAHDAVALSRANAESGYYHLTMPNPLAAARTVEILFESVGMRPPIFVGDRCEFSSIDARFNERTAFYNAYLIGSKRFSRVHTDNQIGSSPSLNFELDKRRLAEFASWYIESELEQRRPAPLTR